MKKEFHIKWARTLITYFRTKIYMPVSKIPIYHHVTESWKLSHSRHIATSRSTEP